MYSSLASNDQTEDEDFKRILLPVLSSNISPLRPSITRSFSSQDLYKYHTLFKESCFQLHQQIFRRQWPFCPIYLVHINTYCHINHLAIPAEIAMVETTFWSQLYETDLDVKSMNLPRKIIDHYERHSNLYKRFCSITDDFHDFVHPGDQLPRGYQADILEHSRRTHGLPCTPYEKLGSEDYNQLIDDLQEMLNSLCDFRHQYDEEPMPMFCTMESFWSTKAALDWLYEQPTTRDRLDDYTLYPIEALIAVIYENFYHQADFHCDLAVLMGKTPQQPVLHSQACDYHAILENKYCAMAHVRDLSKYYISLMAYLFYTYCDQNSARLLPYIKTIYHGDLAMQQEAYWSGRSEMHLYSTETEPCPPPLSSSNRFRMKNYREKPMRKTSNDTFSSTKKLTSDLNPLAIPFRTEKERRTNVKKSTQRDKHSAQIVLFEPRNRSSQSQSCQIIHQRLHRQEREDWDHIEQIF